MLRYIVRLNNSKKSKPQQIHEISSELVRVVEKFGVSGKNFRISEVAIEFDLFANDDESKNRAIEALVLQYGPLLSERNLSEESKIQDKRAVVKLAKELFDEQRYWECHEVMEAIWRREKDPMEKDLQNGVILAASALVHAQKDEIGVCFGMLPRTIEKLACWKGRDYYGLGVDLLRTRLKDMLVTHDIKFQRL